MENPPFLILPLDQIAIEPLNFGTIYKTVLCFQFNQLLMSHSPSSSSPMQEQRLLMSQSMVSNSG